MTIQQIQAAINSKANDPRQLINMIADYLQSNPGGGGGDASYLVYTGYVNQQNPTDAVTINELENTLGAVIWTRNGVGDYSGTSAGLFTENKTFIPPFDLTGYTYLPISDSGFFSYGYRVKWISVNEIKFNLYNAAFAPADLADVVGSSGMIPIEIRVYL